jgi:hypothetical protein
MRNERQRPTLTRLGRGSTVVWVAPLVVAMAVYGLSENRLGDVIGAALALMLVVFLVNRPGPALIALVIFLPVETLLFGLLLQWGVPSAVLRPGGGLKELMALSILLAGLRQIRDTHYKLDRIDIAVLAYVGVVTVYLLVPHLFSSVAPTQWSPRILAWRSDAGYPLVFFGARHAPIPHRTKERLMQVIMAMGAFVALVALYQRLDPVAYTNFVLYTANAPAYYSKVIGLSPADISVNLAYITTLTPLHVSSVFFSPYDLSDYLVMTIAVTAVRMSHNYRSKLNYVVLAVAIGAIFFSRSRSDGLAAIIVVALVALPTSRGPVEGRMRLIASICVAAVLIVPSLGGSRFLGDQGGGASARGHITEIENGISTIWAYPLGLGLGDQPSVAVRFSTSAITLHGGDISDNLITQVGDELGLQALIPWLAMMGFVLWELKRRASRGDVFAEALGFAMLGIVIAGLYHHVFQTYPVPWTVWGGAGLALSVFRDGDPDATRSDANPGLATAGVP